MGRNPDKSGLRSLRTQHYKGIYGIRREQFINLPTPDTSFDHHELSMTIEIVFASAPQADEEISAMLLNKPVSDI